jgi:hypothetical protein
MGPPASFSEELLMTPWTFKFPAIAKKEENENRPEWHRNKIEYNPIHMQQLHRIQQHQCESYGYNSRHVGEGCQHT